MLIRTLILSLVVCCPMLLSGQIIKVKGKVLDASTGEAIDFVTVHQKLSTNATESDAAGNFSLEVDMEVSRELVFSRIGYKGLDFPLVNVNVNRTKVLNIRMEPDVMDIDVTIKDDKIQEANMVTETVEELIKLPSTTGNLESVLPHIALGASSGTGGELSSQYNVRGGNYDENLIYVNDFEIFRPQLIRSGQQEGLTFPNIDLVKDLSFSSGGFEAKYGDKMSSVLDVRYKRPTEFGGSASASLLGATTHVEGATKIAGRTFTYLTGLRYKTTRYLLGSLDVQGEYTPQFFDAQTFLSYDINKAWQVSWIGNYNYNQYNFVPLERSTALGLIDFALRLSTVYEGREEDEFINGMTGVAVTYIPEREKNPFFLKFMGSLYQGQEIESFDILGYYRLSQIETSLGAENAGEEVFVLGTGTQHNYARNFLESNIKNVEHRGGYELQLSDAFNSAHFLQWSIKFQEEQIDDELNEWERIDSAGYSLPFDEENVQLENVFKSTNQIQSTRLSGYVQDTYTFNLANNAEFRLNAGVRFAHWSFNNETIISPRGQILFKPARAEDVSFKLAGGLYYQAPFYREYRKIDGSLNENILSQRSIQVVSGVSYDFDWPRVSDKKFRLITELYYKKLDRLISYDVDNVRIRYSGLNDASGYALGMDVRVNGQFIDGAESWVNLSLLSTREQLNGITHLKREVGDSTAQEVKWVPRPTDRLFNLSIFFQDHLPKNERFKLNMNLSVGSGLPFGIKDNNTIYRNTYRFKLYHRIDMGFSYALWDEMVRKEKGQGRFDWTKNSWISLEVYNLMGVANVASNTWIKTIYGNQYAISNFLTSRRVNLKWYVEF